MENIEESQIKNKKDSTGTTQARLAEKNIMEKWKEREKETQELGHIPRRLSIARSPESKKRKSSCVSRLGVETEEELNKSFTELEWNDQREIIRETKKKKE